jgi:hypothetical protein
MPKRRPNIKDNPEAQKAFERAVEEGKKANDNKPTIKDTKSLLATPAISEAMMDILETSRLTEPQKTFLREVFINRSTRKDAVQTAFNRNLKGQEDAVATGILNHPDVQEFLDMVRMFYVQVAPVAALKEVEVMLDPRSTNKDKLTAAKQISAKGGVTEIQEEKGNLPVNITVNMPSQEPRTVIEMSNDEVEGEVVDDE